jgi:hypothetical protein
MKTDLRLTDTNAASDSRGRTWGLEGSLFWWLVGGIGAAITAFFLLLVVLKMTLGVSLEIALVPLALCLAYIFGLRQGKPPGYDRDWFEYLLGARGFSPDTDRARIPQHPLYES